MTQRIKFLLSIAIIFLLAQPLAQAEVYKWVDENGKTHFSDTKPVEAESQEIDLKINSYESVNYQQSQSNVGNQVIMYSTEWCSYCKKARKYFAKRGIDYKEYDIEKDSRAMREYKKIGGRGVPVILVGDKRMNGFSQRGFERIYN